MVPARSFPAVAGVAVTLVILLAIAPVGAGAPPGKVVRGPFVGSAATSYHRNTTVGCGAAKELFSRMWSPTLGVGGFSEKGRAWICPHAQASSGTSQGWASSNIVISVPVNVTATGSYHIKARIAITVAMPESMPAGTCTAHTSATSASCDAQANVYGHLYGYMSRANSTGAFGQVDLIDFDNFTWTSSTFGSGKWTYGNSSSASRTSANNLTYYQNATLTGGFPYFLNLYLVIDASASVVTSSASLYGNVDAGFNASTLGNHLTLKWITIR